MLKCTENITGYEYSVWSSICMLLDASQTRQVCPRGVEQISTSHVENGFNGQNGRVLSLDGVGNPEGDGEYEVYI